MDALRQELKTVNAELATTKQRLEKEMKSNSMANYHSNGGNGGPGPRTFKAGPSFTSLVNDHDQQQPNPSTTGQTTTTTTRPPRQRVQYEDEGTFHRPSSGHSYGGGGGEEVGYEGGDGTLQPVTARGPRVTRRREEADSGEGDNIYNEGGDYGYGEGEVYREGSGATAVGVDNGGGGGNRRESNVEDGRRRRPGMEANLPPSKFRTSSSR